MFALLPCSWKSSMPMPAISRNMPRPVYRLWNNSPVQRRVTRSPPSCRQADTAASASASVSHAATMASGSQTMLSSWIVPEEEYRRRKSFIPDR